MTDLLGALHLFDFRVGFWLRRAGSRVYLPRLHELALCLIVVLSGFVGASLNLVGFARVCGLLAGHSGQCDAHLSEHLLCALVSHMPKDLSNLIRGLQLLKRRFVIYTACHFPPLWE